ncbi:MAG: DUF72 domain-containing protein [Coriobacteriia bacterium]
MDTGRLLVGTSGWSYGHWRDRFYPEHLPSRRRLAFYATRFATVEVNATFYGLPKNRTIEEWRDAVPAGAGRLARMLVHHREEALLT